MESQQPPASLITDRLLGNMRCSQQQLKDRYLVDRNARLGLGSYGTVYRGTYICPHSNAML
jgi:hypothetical protein